MAPSGTLTQRIRTRIFGPREEERAFTYADWYRLGSAGVSPWTGSAASSASRLPVVYGCVSLLVQRAQLLPPQVLDSMGQPMRVPRWVRHPATMWTWADLVSSAIWSLLLDGNFYILPIRDDAMRPQSLAIPHPAQVFPTTGPDHTTMYYVNGQVYDGEIIHTRNISVPGSIRGLSAIEAARQAVNIGERSQDLVLRHFSQGAQLQQVIGLEGEHGKEAKKEMLAQLEARWLGPENAWRPVILDGGAKLMPVNMTAEQAQYLELAMWTDARIAGQIFHVDPTLVGIVQTGSQLTYSNAVDREANLWKDAIRPLVKRIEEAITMLLPTGHTLELDERALLTGAPRDRAMQATQLAKVNQAAGCWVYTPDEIRAVTGHQPLGVDEPMALPAKTTPDKEDNAMMEDDGNDNGSDVVK